MSALHRVILDTDIGTDVDDLMALALIFGSRDIDLTAVTTVYGDTLLRARMVKRVAHAAGRQIAVHAGEATPLSGREVWWAGHEGVLHNELEQEELDSTCAVQVLVDAVTSSPGSIDIIAIGPLTNIAAAIQQDDGFAAAVRHLWVMGGEFANDEPEHNFRSDVAAARIVFESAIPMTVTGLEVTRRINIGRDELQRVADSGALGQMIEAEIRQWWDFWDTEWNVPHDPVTVLTLTHPELFAFSAHGRVVIDTSDDGAGLARFIPGAGTARITIDLDAQRVAEHIVDGIVAAGQVAQERPAS